MSFFVQNVRRRWFTVLSALLLIVTALQSLLYLTCYDSDIGLYRQGFPIGLLRIGYLLIAAPALSGIIILPLTAIKKAAPNAIPLEPKPLPSGAVDFFALLSAASIAGTLITQLICSGTDDPLSILLQNPGNANLNAHYMLLASLILALPALLWFIAIYARKKWIFAPALTLIWVCAYLLRVYFDSSQLLMSPTRLMTIAALTATIFFLIVEMRLVRGIFSPILYGSAATLTALFAGVSGFSALLLTAVGSLPASTETLYYAFQLCIALFALFRMKAVLSPIYDAYDAASDEEDASRRTPDEPVR